MARLYDRLQTRPIRGLLDERRRGDQRHLDQIERVRRGEFDRMELDWLQRNEFADDPLPEQVSRVVGAHEERRRRRRSESLANQQRPSAEHVIAADEVARFLTDLTAGGAKVEVADIVSTIAPPFSDPFFVEFRRLDIDIFGVDGAGVLVESVDLEDPKRAHDVMDGARWAMKLTPAVELHGDLELGMAVFVSVGDTGTLITEDAGRWFRDLDSVAFKGPWTTDLFDNDADNDMFTRRQWLFAATLLTISFMHCKNVDVLTVEPEPKVSKQHRKKHGRPLTRYHVLDIAPMRQVLRSDGHVDDHGLRHALHICRGHFKTFSPDAPLFGKLTGTYWWADHVRGDQSHGVVAKDYRIRVDSDGLGDTYRPADETPPARRQPGSDPDLSGRGHVAHAVTQNLLADAVRAAGHRPLSPRPEDPQFDLAWMTETDLWLVEVKSLTADNEMSQMHRAVGQVIDYAHRLDTDLNVRKVIAVEQAPVADHWIAECASQGIVLVWPDGFTTILSS